MDTKPETRNDDLHRALHYAENIIATLREPFLVLDKSLRVRTANAAFYHDFHVSRQETEGEFVYELGNGQWDSPQLRKLLSKVLSISDPVEDFEVEHAFPSLGQRHMLLNARRFPPDSDDADMILLAIEDDTERRNAERSAFESEQRFHYLLDKLPAAAYTCDAEGLITYFNSCAAQVWGREPKLNDPIDRFCGSFKLFTITGSPTPRDECWMALALKDSKEFNEREIIIERLDGTRRIGLAHAKPLYDLAGKLAGAINVVIDITDSKEVESALQTSEVRYRRLFQMAKDGILILDAETGKVIDANPFMTDLLGYSHTEFLDKELWEIGLFHDINESRAAYRELQEKGYVRYENLPLESKTGTKIEVEFVSNVYTENDRQVAQCNIRDITERSRLQRLTQEQAAALADLDHRKDEFLAMLSHELRNPLAPILNASLLLRLHSNRNRQLGIENPILHQSATIIERQVGQLSRIVDELLEISRITTGRIQLQQERIALNVIVNNAVETVRPLIDQRKHEFTVSLPLQVIWLYADAARLEQVIVNLLTNAAKYTDPKGHVWISVQQDGREAVLRVRDTGVGIASEILPRIFELFTQAERTLDRSKGGLGIGLALVQRLVEMHGGTVSVSSVVGQGSEFVVRLPLANAEGLGARTEIEDVTSIASSPSPITTKLRVLVVDDNVDTVTTLAMLVQESGHEIRMAYDGASVLETALDYRPDVVLLDIGLPGLNGYEVARQLRQQPQLMNMVLVAMTGYGQERDKQSSKEAGFDHHLVKPGDFGKVLQILATVSELPRR